ncbi:hypothetical protein ACVMII_001846 [Bradyrhizobium diazoefficiens]
MMSRRSVALALTVALLSGPAWSASGNAVKMFDTDNDGTLDLAEVKKAATALFASSIPTPTATGLSRSTNISLWWSSASTLRIRTRTARWMRRS